MKLPPKQMAISVGHFLQSPGLSIVERENEVFAGQSMHLNYLKIDFYFLLSRVSEFLARQALSHLNVNLEVNTGL